MKRKLFTFFAALVTTLLLAAPIQAQNENCPIKHPALTALDYTSMTAAIQASHVGLYGRPPTGQPGSGHDDIGYWIAVSDHYGEFSDGICRAGWSAYWEAKLAGSDSVTPSLGDTPARFRPSIVITPPIVTPPVVVIPPPLPSTDLSTLLARLEMLRVQQASDTVAIIARIALLEEHANSAMKQFVTKYLPMILAAAGGSVVAITR